METTILAIVLLAVIACESSNGKELSEYIPVCNIKDPKINECVVSSAQKMLDIFTNEGIKEHGVVPLEGMTVPKMKITQPGGLSLTLTDAKHYGWTTGNVYYADVSPRELKMVLKLKFDFYSIIGNYDMKGRILVLPISGSGPSNFTMHDIDVTYTLSGTPVKRDGATFLHLADFKLTALTKRVSFDFQYLFGDNHVLSEAMNRFVSKNNKELIEDLTAPVEEAMSELYHGLLKRFFDSVPYNQLFSGLSDNL